MDSIGEKTVGPRKDWSPPRGLIQNFLRTSLPLSYHSLPRDHPILQRRGSYEKKLKFMPLSEPTAH